MRPFWDTDVKVVSRRVKQGSIVRVYRGLYAVKEYWERLDQHERLRHVIRSLGQWHEQLIPRCVREESRSSRCWRMRMLFRCCAAGNAFAP